MTRGGRPPAPLTSLKTLQVVVHNPNPVPRGRGVAKRSQLARPTNVLTRGAAAASAASLPPARVNLPPQQTGSKILVANLNLSVTADDMKELFEAIGPFKRPIRLEKQGDDLVAHIVFQDPAHAALAEKRYHNIPLDGRPMDITVVPPRQALRQ